MLTMDERFALEMARLYRAKGFNPIPSAIGLKKPINSFAEKYGWESKFPDSWFTEEAWDTDRTRTTNLQVLTGRAWRLLVIDLDGSEARYTWKQWGRCPQTWTTHREDGASWHLWFRLPESYPDHLPTRFLWKGDSKHEGIERLCDHSLIVAPPSFHVVHRQSRYRFLNRYCSPEELGLPAPCPWWVLGREPIEVGREIPAYVPPPIRPMGPSRAIEGHLDRNEVLDRIIDKPALARKWGLRLVGNRPDGNGWWPCHAIDRPDERPSAAIHAETGVYTDRGGGNPMSLLDLMVAMGHAHDWKDALQRLSSRI